jgi:glycosyltransferase involved in cell wall biosynthesis
MQHVFPKLPVYRVRNSVDPRFQPPNGHKKHQICFMPRKHAEDAMQVISILKFRGALQGFHVKPIHKLPEDQVISILRESLVFLSFGYPEGFGLPPAEAMASGCVTIGYHGNGGREYFTPEHGFPIEAGDIIGYAKTVELVLDRLRQDPSAFDDMTRRASTFIRSTYSPEHERQDVIKTWTEILRFRR